MLVLSVLHIARKNITELGVWVRKTLRAFAKMILSAATAWGFTRMQEHMGRMECL